MLSFASGGVALAYEVLWTRHLLNLFGSTTTSTAAMLAAFMTGMALGAWTMGRWSVGIRRPLVVYAAMELGLGLYALAFDDLVTVASGILPAGPITGFGEFNLTPAVRLLGHFVVLILPTTLMGATLPALAAAVQATGAQRPRHLAQLYGLNTLGGVLGTSIAGFWALPALGLSGSQQVAAVAAAAVACTAVLVDRLAPRTMATLSENHAASVAGGAWLSSPVALRTALLLSGFAALGYEVLWTRILVLVIGSSTYAFTMMLGAYLSGLALGGMWIGLFLDRLRVPGAVLQHIQLGVALAALAGIAVFPHLPTLALAGIANFGVSPWAVGGVNVMVAAILVLVPTFLIGAALPVAARLMQRGPPRRGRELGTALAWVSAGHVAGVLGTAFVVIPVAGLQGGVVTLASVNVAAALVLWASTRRSAQSRWFVVPASAAALFALGWLLPPWDVNVMTSGVYRQAPAYLGLLGSWRGLERAFAQYRTLFYREGSEAVVGVFERPTLSDRPHIILSLDGKVDASTGADMSTQVLSGHLPMLYRPGARRALVVGLASGVTVGALVRHPLERIDVVEIEGAVVEASKAFDAFSGAPLNDPRVTVFIEDGRQHLRTSGETYDVIVSEPSNPWLSSSARLFTREFFTLARDRLAPEGVFVQWVPLYGLSESQFKALLRTLTAVFDGTAVFRVAESDLLVVASRRQQDLEPQLLEQILERPLVRANFEQLGIRAIEEVMALWVADRNGLSAVVGEGPINTDDNGLIEFGSPWYVLRDTKPANLAILHRATASSAIVERLAVSWAGPDAAESLATVARLHLDAGRASIARALAIELDKRGEATGDILLGDMAASEGDLETAANLWRRQATPQAWSRLAELELRRENARGAVTLYERLDAGAEDPDVLLGYGLALAALGEHTTALRILSGIRPQPGSLPGLIAPLLRAAELARTGQSDRAIRERQTFVAAVDRLRQRLEAERGQDDLNALLAWIGTWRHALPPEVHEELRRTVYQRITRPLAGYYRGVSQLWLGEYALAETSLETYLEMLPESDSPSKARELLFLARGQEADKL